MDGRGSLRSDVADLRILVRYLQEWVRLLALDRESQSGYTVVEARSSPQASNSSRLSSPSATSPPPTASASCSTPGPDSEREGICRAFGAWIEKAIRASSAVCRGVSASLRDYQDRVFDPVEVYHKWSDLCPKVSATGWLRGAPIRGERSTSGSLPSLTLAW